MYLRLTFIIKKTSPKCHFTYFFHSVAPLITLLTAGALTDLQLPATASNVCMTDARLGGNGSPDGTERDDAAHYSSNQ